MNVSQRVGATKESDVMNRAERRRRAPAKPRQVARYGANESAKRVLRKVTRRMRGLRTVDTGLIKLGTARTRRCDGAPPLSAGLPANAVGLDATFGIASPLQLVAFGVGRIDFNDHERRRRRARNKRQRAARRAGR